MISKEKLLDLLKSNIDDFRYQEGILRLLGKKYITSDDTDKDIFKQQLIQFIINHFEQTFTILLMIQIGYFEFNSNDFHEIILGILKKYSKREFNIVAFIDLLKTIGFDNINVKVFYSSYFKILLRELFWDGSEELFEILEGLNIPTILNMVEYLMNKTNQEGNDIILLTLLHGHYEFANFLILNLYSDININRPNNQGITIESWINNNNSSEPIIKELYENITNIPKKHSLFHFGMDYATPGRLGGLGQSYVQPSLRTPSYNNKI